MLWLAVYDIAQPKRLKKVATVCEKYGIRLQKSQFQINVEPERLKLLVGDLKRIMKKKEDSIIIYPICLDCRRFAIAVGPNQILDPDECIIL